ncbi:hypothetical protein LTR36_010129 [Oleoguttula mirabilis]|uniref:Uncharacterized protein n=1 Tax=Oleoguttula mirabilis TaxID=1507867 RepID=A0AAV9JS48_9PEZI|nr:hypothetical protein LTR36_010129 [Oleoguttula mirabilis]
MCVVERKTYVHADGHRETIESTHGCHGATGSGLCDRIEYRSSEEARIVERRPNLERRGADNYLITEGRDGRERVYRDVTRRSSNRTSNTIRRSNTTGNRASRENTSPASSPSAYSSVEVRPLAPSPPPTTPAFPILERERRPRYGTNQPQRIVAADGTAVYERPPSLNLPRARENERHARFAEPEVERRSPISAAEIDEPFVLEPPRRRPSIIVERSARIPRSSMPSASSPGLSQLPKLSHARNDSARDIPKDRSQDPRRESSHRQQAEDDRQAQIERDRLAEPERRQQARRNAEDAAREASRERQDRHRRETAAALEGNRRGTLREEQLEAELAQVARERAAADARKRESDQSERYTQDQLRRDAEARERYYQTRPDTSPRLSRRMTGAESSYTPYNSSPLSARSPIYGGVQLHQSQYLPARRESSISAKGAEVIAREQARASTSEEPQRATRRLSDVLGDTRIEDEEYERRGADADYELDDVYVGEGLQRRERRRERRDVQRAENKREFWARDDRYP